MNVQIPVWAVTVSITVLFAILGFVYRIVVKLEQLAMRAETLSQKFQESEAKLAAFATLETQIKLLNQAFEFLRQQLDMRLAMAQQTGQHPQGKP